MSRITTVCGDIALEELGYTDMHEHVMFDGTDMGNICRPGMPGNLPIQWEDKISLENIGLLKRNFTLCRDAMNLDDEEVMTGEVADYKESGGDSLLELSVPGIRLDVAAIKRISEKTGVNIITATGFYIESSWMGRFDGWNTADFYKRIMDEFENGIEGTGIKPGCVKIALSSFTQREEMSLRAGGQAVKETGMSITVHPCGRGGGEPGKVVEILKEEGVPAEKIVIAHVPMANNRGLSEMIRYPELWALNLDVAKSILAEGANISVEFMSGQIDLEALGSQSNPDYMKLAGLVKLINEGHCRQMVLGTDMCVKTMTRRCGGEGYCRLTKFAVPALKQYGGVSDYAVRSIMIENPARILAY